MKLSYEFANLLGASYVNGTLQFTNSGHKLISPVGNRVKVFDLQNHVTETLSAESSYNIVCLTVSPNGNILIAVNEQGEALICSLVTRAVINRHYFRKPITAIAYSPDSKYVVALKGNKALVLEAPGTRRRFNALSLRRAYAHANDDCTSIDFTDASDAPGAFVVGSRDGNARVCALEPCSNLHCYALGGMNDAIVAAFFISQSLDVVLVSANGYLCVYECDTKPNGLKAINEDQIQRKRAADDESASGSEDSESEKEASAKRNKLESRARRGKNAISYRRVTKHRFKDANNEVRQARVTSAAFHKRTHLLVAGFADGVFLLVDVTTPTCELVQALSVGDCPLTSVALSGNGEWVAVGSAQLGLLVCWDWPSSSYVLRERGYPPGTQQLTSVDYSPDGSRLATGAENGAVQLWNALSGLSVVTFTEHRNSVKAVRFAKRGGTVLLSAGLDGAVRAYDLHRYRVFRTMSASPPCQFSSLATDPSGELIVASSLDSFQLHVFALVNGHQLAVLSGHEAPISGLAFSPADNLLATCSWDHSVRFWNITDSKLQRTVAHLQHDALALAFRPDGRELAVATLNGCILLLDSDAGEQRACIEGRADLGYVRRDGDRVSGKKLAARMHFECLHYSADGRVLLAAGPSKFVCLYSTDSQLLLKRFEVCANLSLDGTLEFLDRRKMTEFGNLELQDPHGETDGATYSQGRKIALPGVKRGEFSARSWKPEVRVVDVRFAPTGRAFCAATTTGLLVYSLDHSLVFDPLDFTLDVSSDVVLAKLAAGQHQTALEYALRLNEKDVTQRVVESIPLDSVTFICKELPEAYVDRLIEFVAFQLERNGQLERYLRWLNCILMERAPQLKAHGVTRQSALAAIVQARKMLAVRSEQLGHVCNHNKYLLEFIQAAQKLEQSQTVEQQSATSS